ncbi:hypothetical protein ACP70R_014119 [Stipagrostis hirtigluma subsp. patula]
MCRSVDAGTRCHPQHCSSPRRAVVASLAACRLPPHRRREEEWRVARRGWRGGVDGPRRWREGAARPSSAGGQGRRSRTEGRVGAALMERRNGEAVAPEERDDAVAWHNPAGRRVGASAGKDGAATVLLYTLMGATRGDVEGQPLADGDGGRGAGWGMPARCWISGWRLYCDGGGARHSGLLAK